MEDHGGRLAACGTGEPTGAPSTRPTARPTTRPTRRPTNSPTTRPRKEHEERLAPEPTYTYLGCYKDKKGDRSFSYEAQNRGASTSDCALLCRSHAYFLRQFKGQCFCGSSRYDKHGTSGKCKCDSSNVGSYIGCAYQYTVKEVVEPPK